MHDLITSSTNHHYLFLRLARQVEAHSMHIRSLVEAIASENDVLCIIDEHYVVLDALRARDPELSRRRLTGHLEAGMERTLAALEQMLAIKT